MTYQEETPTETLPRLVVFISGSGSNLQAILDAIAAGTLHAQVACVVSNRKDAFGLTRAERAQIETLYFPLKPYTDQKCSREAYDADLADCVRGYHPDLIVLAGWMHILSDVFLGHFPNKVINLHPALPGMFPGTDAIEQALKAFQRGDITHTGCMMHYAIPEVDAGPVIVQADVPLYADDTLTTVKTRMHTTEHRIIVEAIQIVLGNRCEV